MNTECPSCFMENAYFDGSLFCCPDCDYEWDNDTKEDNFNNEWTYFGDLSKKEKPYFKLNHGKIYECDVQFKDEIEEISIIPLAFDKGKNQQFILCNAKKLNEKHPKIVQEIIKMDFIEIWNDGTADYPNDFSVFTTLCATNSDKTLVDSNDSTFYILRETDLI